MKRISFFATPDDIVPLLRCFESRAPLKFMETGNFSTPNSRTYLNSSDLPQPGISTAETGSQSRAYLVSHRDTKGHLRTFAGQGGAPRWALDQLENPETTVLTMAGLWSTGTLLPGNMSTVHASPPAKELMRWFLGALKQEAFRKVQSWWVGKEALGMLLAGRRLATAAEQSPPEFDLVPPVG